MFILGRTTVRASSLAGLFWAATPEEKLPTPGSNNPIQLSQPEQKKGDLLLSRKIVNQLDKSGLDLRLYQYETCPFCCKVRAFLDYYGFSYEVVEVNPVTRKQINFSIDYKKVPIVRINNEKTFTESSLIISELATYVNRPDRTLDQIEAMYPVVDSVNEKGAVVKSHPNKYFVMIEKILSDQQMASAKEEREWREWVDNHFIHLISPNVYRTWEESLETFKWFDQALYGSMNSFHGTRAFKEVIGNGGKIAEWFAAVHKLVTEHQGRVELEKRFK